MKSKSNIKLNFLYNSIYQILLIILPLITSPYISRVLGKNGIGIYSYTYSLASTFALIGMLGVSNYGNRAIATVQDNRNERSKIFWNIWSLQLFVSSLMILFYIVYLIFLCPEQYILVSWVQIITILCSVVDINWFFFGMERFKVTVIRNIIIKILSVCMIFLFVKSKNDVWIYTLIIVGGMFLSNIIIWPFLLREVDIVRPKWNLIKSHFRQTLLLFVPVIAIMLYNKMDKVMIGSLSDMNQTGLFENTDKIITIPLSFITALGTVMLPRMSYLFAKKNKKEILKYISVSMEFVCFMSAAMAFGIAGIAIEFAPLFFGMEFSETGILIMALAPKIIFIAWANVIRTQYLIPLHKDRVYVISVWLGAIVNLFVNFLLIPSMGAMGAIIGTILAEATVMIYQTICVWNEIPIRKYINNGIYYFIAGIIMFIVIRLIGVSMKGDIYTVFIQIILGGILYCLLCLPYVVLRYSHEIKESKLVKKYIKVNNN